MAPLHGRAHGQAHRRAQVGVAGPESAYGEGEGASLPTRRTRSAPASQSSRPPYILSGCEPVPLSCGEVADYEGRYEYWEAATETAWVLRQVSRSHEHPSSRLVALVDKIAMLRGRPIWMYGTADLQERKPDGTRVYAAQPDQMIYLDRPDEPAQGGCRRRISAAGRRVRGGPDHGHPRPQARSVRFLARPGAVGRGSRRRHAEQAQAVGVDHLPDGQRRVSGRARRATRSRRGRHGRSTPP